MSWTLFIQLFVLIFLVGCIVLAAIDKLKAKPIKNAGKTMFYMNREKPTPPVLIDGDMWMNPETNEIKVWDTKKSDWKEVKA